MVGLIPPGASPAMDPSTGAIPRRPRKRKVKALMLACPAICKPASMILLLFSRRRRKVKQTNTSLTLPSKRPKSLGQASTVGKTWAPESVRITEPSWSRTVRQPRPLLPTRIAPLEERTRSPEAINRAELKGRTDSDPLDIVRLVRRALQGSTKGGSARLVTLHHVTRCPARGFPGRELHVLLADRIPAPRAAGIQLPGPAFPMVCLIPPGASPAMDLSTRRYSLAPQEEEGQGEAVLRIDEHRQQQLAVPPASQLEGHHHPSRDGPER
ncbi:hypothetical protein HPB50_008409 [Hyalomma asiaticum]|uniref:Uncharacterized protein n=1 Tax=Hyalomma asiaticum TaxID=266040 RepID=A0ACB7RLR3_HYAAI|nr:hypothetical protein HPB50_008409 [Hyalomma asiaticum]